MPQQQLHRIIPLLNDYCKQSGWLLCQIFQHEKSAYFCVCASKSAVGDLIMLDVCGDYTVRGIRQVPSQIFIENRTFNEEKQFWVLNHDAELAYVLTKAAAKKKKPEEVMGRVQELLVGMDDAARTRMAGFLPQQKCLSPAALLDDPAGYILSSDWSQQIGRASGSSWFELARKLRRVMQPTGFHIEISAASDPEYMRTAEMLERALHDTCRNTWVIAPGDHGVSCKDLVLAKIKSTLILSRAGTAVWPAVVPRRFGVDLKIEGSVLGPDQEIARQWILDQVLAVRERMAGRTCRRWLNQ
ncbi:MAG: hypothetical protein H7A51_11105 [Akkermansiaceae bacterium]|nr:hypothetical protein [Akkermansiaceae bacterium]